MDALTFKKLLVAATLKNVSDIHLQVGASPMFRINGELLQVKYHPLTAKETYAIVDEILSQSIIQLPASNSLAELDVAYNLEGHGRFRANIYLQRGAYNIVLRAIPVLIKTFAQLNLPPVLEKISLLQRGLVLVVGATGNGKSTTVASMLQYINTTRRSHIVTIEEPIEYVFENKMSVISQREVGVDTESFSKATVAAMRQDPDVIFVGEMRDKETVDTVLKAAETGHLVISTMHTMDSINAISRLVAFYPADEETNIRKRLSNCLMSIIAQRLMPKKDRIGRIPAVEILWVTQGIRDCICDASKTDDIHLYIEKGRDIYGMQTFDQHILALVKSGKIDIETAKQATNKPEELERSLMLDNNYG
ncbi:MAG: PilT/PilU family type 4a pilus ATPase [Geobacteraceae bacterium]|nr:PilT/PilU family type 4a pilus ATPase [Geobacteraceae bacterium]